MDTTQKRISFEEIEEKIKEKMSFIKHRIAIFSGKGGVGKTTVAVNLAFALKLDGNSSGILDADITGPNVAKMFGLTDDLMTTDSSIIPFEKKGVKMISAGNMIREGQPIIWRGPMRSKLINQFLSDVDWGELDYLVADLPPGTGDEILTIVEQMKPDYAIIVTTPQEVSLIDAARAINMAIKLEVKNIGVIENMSGLVCPHCGNEIDLFGTGGGERLARQYGVKFLGSIPMEIKARKLCDEGRPIVLEDTDNPVSKSFVEILGEIKNIFQEMTT